MASSSSSTKFVLFPYLLLACLFLFTFSTNLVVAKESDKVKLNLYYESLCPYCQNFIVDDLGKIFDSDLYTITDLKLVPFGNAHVSNNLTITCQHGEEECILNALEACAIRIWPDPKLHYKFIQCVEKDTNEWETCVQRSGREKAIKDCYNGDLSKKLILGYAKQTLSLEPKHEYVPWVTLNGKPLYDKYHNLAEQICKVYKGKVLPKICSSSTLSERKVSKLQVSYVYEAKNY
ncbi:PREDICTED: gamma-interferon-inducible lysosomal thiol reductase-like [Camelina sativa]|uniref:Gamma-interferon-inducible lysosomal thiol reductase-like n=1 Tax=Camelina sativa TaxID=90675 RepID=A0ABM0V3L6_CAMSA|nr:PREDICTED: gamma-interferon-inducible lysosomal thiol reductase-like [Camelina sativa]